MPVLDIDTSPYQGALAGVLGGGRSGQAAARLLHALGARVRVLDKNPETLAAAFPEAGARELFELVGGEHEARHFVDLDMLVMSPGIAVSAMRQFFPPGLEVLAELELASRCVTEPIVAITGTNGKTTTCTLAADMLREAGRRVFLGGNIGTPLSAYLLGEDRAEVVVVEASSFQLQHCETFHPKVAALLNFSADHLDYHKDLEEYLEAKLRIFTRQTPKDLAIAPLSLKAEIEAHGGLRARIHWLDGTSRFTSTTLFGEHNRQNMEAAFLAVQPFGVEEDHARAAIEAFTPLPHRLEVVGRKRGVTFIDDSKATTADSLKAALESLTSPVRLLAGGVYKGVDGADLRALCALLRDKVESVGLYGGSRETFEDAWKDCTDVRWSPTLGEAFTQQAALARPGDVVLLSPATSSFDQYKDYKARGEDFRRHVEAL